MPTFSQRRRRPDSGTKPLPLPGGSSLLLLLLSLAFGAAIVLFYSSSSLIGRARRRFPGLPMRTVAAPPSAPGNSAAAHMNHSAPPQRNPSPLYEGTMRAGKRARRGDGGPYHDWGLFREGFEEMMKTLKIFVYPDIRNASSSFAGIFLPHPNPSNPKLGNYYSEHIFKFALLHSPLLTTDHLGAQLFFMPFSVNALRNNPRVRSEAAISDFVAGYAEKVRREFKSWNASGGADHFYVSCHSVGRDAAARHCDLRDHAIHVGCSSSYFHRNFVAHKDVALPQIWPRPPEINLKPPEERKRLVFFAGRAQNSQVRRDLITLWENDTSMDIFSGSPPFPYEEGFRRSRFCLHVKGYEVNTARVADSIHYGCIPVILSNYYDLPFASVLDWSKFSVVINHRDVAMLKKVLLSFPPRVYLAMYDNLVQVRRHFVWHVPPRGYDSFYMTVHQLWLKRSTHLGPCINK